MSKAKRAATLSGMIDSDLEDAMFSEMSTLDSAAENRAPAKKAIRGRAKAAPTKVTKTKAPARRTSGRINVRSKPKAPPVAKGRRKALADKTNQQYDGETDEVDDFEQDLVMEGMEAEKVVEKAKHVKKAAAPRGRPAKNATRTSVDDSQAVPEPALVKTGRPARKEIPEEQSPEKIIQETQVDPIHMDADGEEDVEETLARRVQHVNQQKLRPQLTSKHRAGSGSDTERNDPTLRRKLGEMTKKYENLQLNYQELREVGVKEYEKNYEKMRKNGEDKAKGFDQLLAATKADLALKTRLANESAGLQKKLDTQALELASLQLQLGQMSATLSEAQASNKTLSAKLAATRTLATSVESANVPKIPGSAMKANTIRMIGSQEAVQAAQAAQLKEDIYSDLTGLLIRAVERKAEEDVFDCLQTGRNGTLHFKLSAANEKAASYDDAQCSYTPQLNRSRDAELMELLPDYLVDEITFPRQHAAKFFSRVVKALTEKPVLAEN